MRFSWISGGDMLLDLGAVVVFLLGAAVGSFLNVVIHRLPREESLVFPGSHCPFCGNAIRPWHNVPILGFLLLRGRCKDCGERISVRYPLVEALVAVLSTALWAKYGPSWTFAAYFVLTAGLVAVMFIDIDHMIIPDSLSLGGLAVGVVLSLFTGVGWLASLVGVAAGGGSLLAVYLAYFAVTRREGMGLGDVKLLAAIGAFLGWQAVLFTILVSSVAGALVGGATVGFRLQREVPYGAFLAPAAILYLFCGHEVIHWYVGRIP
jgi:leader peptidase (prepilin peptidase)/N-methyltransferase